MQDLHAVTLESLPSGRTMHPLHAVDAAMHQPHGRDESGVSAGQDMQILHGDSVGVT